jgi:hypothetical protein
MLCAEHKNSVGASDSAHPRGSRHKSEEQCYALPHGQEAEALLRIGVYILRASSDREIDTACRVLRNASPAMTQTGH